MGAVGIINGGTIGNISISEYNQWIETTAKKFADDTDPNSTTSMGDIEGVAMVYAEMHGITNDDKVIDDLRAAIDKQQK